MYLHFRLKSLRCIKGDDRWGDPDFYFTWQVYQDTEPQALLQQGFSTGCPIDEGHTVAPGEQVTLTDTNFTFKLPALQPGEQTRVWVDFIQPEVDTAERMTRALFN